MEDEFSKLIGLIYETVFDDELWPDVLIRLADLCDAHVPAIGFFDPATRQASAIAPRTDPSDLLKFENYWAERSPLFSDMAGIPPGAVVSMQDLVPASVMKATPVYNELLRPMGLGSAALLANIAPATGARAVLGLYRETPRHDQAFGRDQVELVAKAVSHMTRAVEFTSRMNFLRLGETSALLALERLRKGVMLLDTAGRILFCNELASRMLDGDDGNDGGLPPAIDICLRKAAVVGHGENAIWQRGPERAPLHLSTMPLRANGPPWFGLRGPAVVIVMTDPDLEAEHRASVIRNRYGLTQAEVSFALEIAKGDGREAAASRCGIAVSTAHTHLNRIFEKTGVTRQAELVRLLLSDDLGF